MKQHVKFTGCKNLDYTDNYTAEKVLINLGGKPKVCWDRPVIDNSYPRLVQFCKLRGRLNYPEMCTCEGGAQCSDYENYLHEIDIDIVQD